jgi:hypothetical protein
MYDELIYYEELFVNHMTNMHTNKAPNLLPSADDFHEDAINVSPYTVMNEALHFTIKGL